jgi:ADP-ribosylglycohydrolase
VRDPWLRQHPMLLASRAPGNACLTGLTASLRGTQDRRVNRQSKGCGTVMRSAPYGLVSQWTADECVRQSIAGSFLSHGHETAAAAAAAFTLIIRLIIDGADVRSAALTCLDDLPRLVDVDTSETCAALAGACQAAVTGAPTPASVTSLGEGWVAEEALAIGLFAALVHGDDITAALTLAVTHSGDSDSTGSICGNLLGAAHGLGKLPEDLAARNEAAPLIAQLTAQLD